MAGTSVIIRVHKRLNDLNMLEDSEPVTSSVRFMPFFQITEKGHAAFGFAMSKTL